MKHTILIFFTLIYGLKLFSQNPVADFDVNIIYKCGFATTEFINNSQNADTFFWDTNGNGDFFETFEPNGSNIGTDKSWTVTLIAIGNGMSDTLSKQVDIFQTRANFSYSLQDTNGFAPTNVEFINQSFTREEDTLTLNWDFGDGFHSDLENPVHNYTTPNTYFVKLTGLKNSDCELSSSDYIIVKDTAQKGEFDFITSDCYNDYEIPPCGYEKHFEIGNDSLLIYGFYDGNCGTTKTATIRYSGDTVLVRTWEVGPLTTCYCGYCFEIGIPNISQDSAIVKFNNQIYMARISGILKRSNIEKSINIYPNPTSNFLIVDFYDSHFNNLSYEILDINGVQRQSGVLNQQNKIKINRQKLTKGFYIIVLKNENEIKYTKKLILY